MSKSLGSDVALTDNDLGSVLRNSEEWACLEYMLQIHTRTSRVRLLQAWQVSPPAIVNKFEKRCMGRLVLNSFIDAASLGEDNSIQDVCRRGIKIGYKGMKISVGNFSLPGLPLMKGGKGNEEDPYQLNPVNGQPANKTKSAMKDRGKMLQSIETQLLSGERRVFEMFICEIGVGHSVVVQDERDASGDRLQLMLEYDSAYIQNGTPAPDEVVTVHYKKPTTENVPQLSFANAPDLTKSTQRDILTATLGVLPQYTFHHEYVVYDHSQILPRYLVQLEFDPTYEELFSIPLCDNCQEAPSSIWCPSDTARLCEHCDHRLHSHNKLVSRHIRVPLNEMPRSIGKCKLHPSETYELFCTMCHIPVCRLCRSNHSHTDTSGKSFLNTTKDSRTLIPLGKAYRGVLQMSRMPHIVLDTRRKELNKLLDEVQELLDQVRCNSREVEQRCYSILEDAMQQLQRQSEEKMGIVLGDQIEIRRQIDQIEWSESFLQYLKSVLPPADYLMAWLRHCRLRDDLQSMTGGTGELSKNIYPDLRLEGRIDLMTDSALQHRNQLGTKANS